MRSRWVLLGACVMVGQVSAQEEGGLVDWPAPLAEKVGRYYGLQQVGSDPYNYESLALTIDADLKTVTLEWALHGQEDLRGRKRLEVSDVTVSEKGVSLRVKGARPATVPERLVGRFAKKFPRGKGPVEVGLAFGEGWFLER